MIDASDKRLEGLRLSVRERLARAINHAQITGTINRADIRRLGEVSVTQASIDLREIKARFPKLLVYDVSAKTYLATDRIAAPQIAGNPESWGNSTMDWFHE
ncbi:hypothetical protein [Methylocystis sp. SC2]|uniref:hypothetical protein n=1 Tax=Methylocystis sp. (strain SC2) TaxID=187303 RepID=UPI00027AEF35|nr:hypothetical protein [Methylocystis sp. SC2]CCJ07035.1 Hypothetical protein BN69_1584 [Methylocystis sp. SC2]